MTLTRQYVLGSALKAEACGEAIANNVMRIDCRVVEDAAVTVAIEARALGGLSLKLVCDDVIP